MATQEKHAAVKDTGYLRMERLSAWLIEIGAVPLWQVKVGGAEAVPGSVSFGGPCPPATINLYRVNGHIFMVAIFHDADGFQGFDIYTTDELQISQSLADAERRLGLARTGPIKAE